MRSQQTPYTFIRNSIQRMPENISDEKVGVICLFTDKGRLEARPSLIRIQRSHSPPPAGR